MADAAGNKGRFMLVADSIPSDAQSSFPPAKATGAMTAWYLAGAWSHPYDAP
jgi:hypothetical protein